MLSPAGIGNPGYLALIIGAVGFGTAFKKQDFSREIALFCGLALLIFYLLSLGPTLQFAGRDTGITLPYSLLQNLPVISSGRNPGRFTLVALLALGIMVAVGLSELARFLESRFVAPASVRSVKHIRTGVVEMVLSLTFIAITLAGFVIAAGDASVDPPNWPPFYQQE